MNDRMADSDMMGDVQSDAFDGGFKEGYDKAKLECNKEKDKWIDEARKIIWKEKPDIYPKRACQFTRRLSKKKKSDE